jgi:hypothetical protein
MTFLGIWRGIRQGPSYPAGPERTSYRLPELVPLTSAESGFMMSGIGLKGEEKAMANDQVQESLPPDRPALPREPIAAPAELRVVCPRCRRPTDSLKVCHPPNVLFIGIYTAWNSERVVGCPACLRKVLFRKMLLAVPASKLVFPIVASFYLLDWTATLRKGHTDPAVAQAHQMNQEEHLDALQKAVNLRKPPRREFLLLGIILLVIAVFWGIASLLKQAEPEATVDGKTVSQWIEQLRDPEALNRIQAARTLGAFGPRADKAVPELVRVIEQDVDAWVGWSAYQALRDIDPVRARQLPIPPLPMGLPGVRNSGTPFEARNPWRAGGVSPLLTSTSTGG